ncbi:MAG: hypothetical protein SFY32_13660 [Bacteroidota bacterium]|nr:hypothetical protein [Bacteroidota bacterium]
METLIINTQTESQKKAFEELANSMNLSVFHTTFENDFALGVLMMESKKSGFLGVEATEEYFNNLKNEIKYK